MWRVLMCKVDSIKEQMSYINRTVEILILRKNQKEMLEN